MQAGTWVHRPHRRGRWQRGAASGFRGGRGGRWFTFWLVGAAWLLAGCTVGPDYHPPRPAMPDRWQTTGENGAEAGPLPLAHWWTLFEDERLGDLVARALDANPDLKIAAARVREARALWRAAGAEEWPSLDAIGAYTRLRRSENVPSSAVRNQDLYQAGFDAGWEIDLFGGVRRSVESAAARAAAAEENRRDVMVTLSAEVAVNYLTLRGSQRRLEIARENIQIQRETVDLTEGRLAAGLGSRLAVVQARSLLASTEARVPALEAAIRQAVYRLDVLMGREPGALLDDLLVPGAHLPPPPAVPVGLPSDLLRRRPDIRSAERELAAATADIGVATAELFPHFSLGALFGLQSAAAADLLSASSRFWSVGPTLRWPVFDAGRVRALIRVATARQETALALYEKTILTALEEVESAMVGAAKGREADAALARAVETIGQSADIALALYQKGLVDFLNVLQSEQALYQVQDQFVQHRQDLAVTYVGLFKALGGGWEPDADAPGSSPPAVGASDVASPTPWAAAE